MHPVSFSLIKNLSRILRHYIEFSVHTNAGLSLKCSYRFFK